MGTRYVPPGKRLVFTPWIKDPRTGVVRHASAYGKKVFAILVDA
jgi:hypothetical protein